MLIALITITFLLAFATVLSWRYREKWLEAKKLNAELLEQNADQLKVIEGARMVAKIAARGMREQEIVPSDHGDFEWPEFIEGKVS